MLHLPAAGLHTARPADRVGEVRAEMEGRSFDCADVAVLQDERMVGVVPVDRLLKAAPQRRMDEVMDPDPPVVGPGTGTEAAAWALARGSDSSAAVVDRAGRFWGLIPANRLLAEVLAEHNRYRARLGGYLAGTRRAREAAREPVVRRLWHRLPWLLIGLTGAMLSALIVGAFESQLEEKVLLALFVPAVVYMADAVGTQTETVVIRGLSVGVDVREVFRREAVSGLAIGVVIAGAFLAFVAAVWGDGRVALAVALALLASCSIATLVAMALPWAFQRLGRDPAFGSGPLATVVQDLLSVTVYLGIAATIAL
jgi:magnesium transporter